MSAWVHTVPSLKRGRDKQNETGLRGKHLTEYCNHRDLGTLCGDANICEAGDTRINCGGSENQRTPPVRRP